MQCLLKGSEKYCETWCGICCASCGDRDGCDKVCLNDPSRCGCAGEPPASFTPPVPTPWKGGRHVRN